MVVLPSGSDSIQKSWSKSLATWKLASTKSEGNIAFSRSKLTQVRIRPQRPLWLSHGSERHTVGMLPTSSIQRYTPRVRGTPGCRDGRGSYPRLFRFSRFARRRQGPAPGGDRQYTILDELYQTVYAPPRWGQRPESRFSRSGKRLG